MKMGIDNPYNLICQAYSFKSNCAQRGNMKHRSGGYLGVKRNL